MSQTKLISLDNLTRYDGKIKQLITTVTPASATPASIASSGVVGTSTKYAREDHTHAISVATGDSDGQVKIAGQNASVKGFSDKQDKFERISYADWQLLTPQQQAAKPYYIYDYPSSAITAGNVAYDNTSSGMSADDVQEAVDELNSGLIAKIDQITLGEVTGATTFADFILSTLHAANLGHGKLTVVYSIYPMHDYYIFYIMHLYDDVYMFMANSSTKMYHGKAYTEQNYVEVYEVTSTLVTN